MRHRNHTRADSARVTNILSDAYAVTLPTDEDTEPEPINPEKVEKMGFPLAWLQQVMWESYPGLNGPNTLLKEVEYSTSECDECGGEGWKDFHGDTICDDCGMVLNSTPELVPRDYDTGDRAGGPTGSGGHYVYFNAGGKPALNDNVNSYSDEPDVQ